MVKILIISIAIIVASILHTMCSSSLIESRRRERDARKWDDD